MKKGKYLITGCAGFIGSNLVKRIYKNYDLILVDDLSVGSVSNLPKKLRKKLIKKNIGVSPRIIRRKLDKFDPIKSSGTYKKIFKYLNLRKYNFTKLENGLIETIDSMK